MIHHSKEQIILKYNCYIKQIGKIETYYLQLSPEEGVKLGKKLNKKFN